MMRRIGRPVREGEARGRSLHAGVVAKGNERKKLERLCRTVSRPAVSEERPSLSAGGQVRHRHKRGPTVTAPGFVRLRAAGFPRAAGRAGAQAAGQSHPLPRRVRAQQPTPGRW